MAIEVFNRYENKYMLDADTLGKLQSRLSEYMELDEYNKQQETYPISNLYYDTPDHYLIRTSLQKPIYKEKLRVRAYGVPGREERVYVEMKKKVTGLVNKRRSSLILAEAYDFLQTGILPAVKPYQNRQVLGEIAYMRERYELCPALYLAYDRKAYFGVGQHDLRISFDCNIMEIKSAYSIPVWLSGLLSQYKIYPISFSKYGVEYRRMISRPESSVVFRYQPEAGHLPGRVRVAM